MKLIKFTDGADRWLIYLDSAELTLLKAGLYSISSTDLRSEGPEVFELYRQMLIQIEGEK